MNESFRPARRPTCKHGNSIGSVHHCKECHKERMEQDRVNKVINMKLAPLVDEYWNSRGKLSGALSFLLRRAYKMGIKDKEKINE